MSSGTLERAHEASLSIGQLIYRSISRSGARGAIEISDILAEARHNNREQQLTGVLTIVGSEFVQVLEGPEAALDSLLTALKADPRHEALRVLERRQINDRAFADWDMVSPRLTPSCAKRLAALLARDETRLDAYVPVLTAALATQDRASAEWLGRQSGEQA